MTDTAQLETVRRDVERLTDAEHVLKIRVQSLEGDLELSRQRLALESNMRETSVRHWMKGKFAYQEAASRLYDILQGVSDDLEKLAEADLTEGELRDALRKKQEALEKFLDKTDLREAPAVRDEKRMEHLELLLRQLPRDEDKGWSLQCTSEATLAILPCIADKPLRTVRGVVDQHMQRHPKGYPVDADKEQKENL